MCMRTLGGIAKDGKTQTVQISAIALLLERGWGRPAQPVTGADGEGDIRITIRNILEGTKK